MKNAWILCSEWPQKESITNKATLKTKYEPLKEFYKHRPNKEVAIQFNVPRSTLSTWNQPISTAVWWIDYFWIFWTTCRGNCRRGWWKRRWRIRWTSCTSRKKWSWRDNQTSNRLSLFTEDLGFDTLTQSQPA